jgi:hypothetical protein
MRNVVATIGLVILGTSAAAISTPCLAALGGSKISIQADQLHMKGSLRVKAQENYSVHEIQSFGGTVVREYATTDGVVFGVTWRGPAIPDLRQLLGPRFTEYVESAKTQRGEHGHLRVDDPGLVVHSSGHMRAFFGRAYIPQLLPPNVNIDEIQ